VDINPSCPGRTDRPQRAAGQTTAGPVFFRHSPTLTGGPGWVPADWTGVISRRAPSTVQDSPIRQLPMVGGRGVVLHNQAVFVGRTADDKCGEHLRHRRGSRPQRLHLPAPAGTTFLFFLAGGVFLFFVFFFFFSGHGAPGGNQRGGLGWGPGFRSLYAGEALKYTVDRLAIRLHADLGCRHQHPRRGILTGPGYYLEVGGPGCDVAAGQR